MPARPKPTPLTKKSRKKAASLEPRSHSLPIDWLRLELASQAMRSVESSDYTEHELLEFLLPFEKEYASKIPSVFLFALKDLEVLNRSQAWIVRDGLISLFWFFKRFPEPEAFFGRLIVDEEFIAIVPQAWKKQIGFYRYVSLPSLLPGMKRPRPDSYRLLLYGLNSELFLSEAYLRERLDTIAKQVKKRKLSEVLLFLPVRSLATDQVDEMVFPNERILEIVHAFDLPVRSLKYGDLAALSRFSDVIAAELNHKLICADGFMRHYLATRGAEILGAGELDARTKKEYDEIVATGIDHGFAIGHGLPRAKVTEAARTDLSYRILDTTLGTKFSWPAMYEATLPTRAETSPASGAPTGLQYGASRWELGCIQIGHSLDLIRKDQEKTVIEGWAYDPQLGNTWQHIALVSSAGTINLRSTRRKREDVVASFADQDPGDRELGWGFEFEIPDQELEWHLERGARTFWLVALLPRAFGVVLEQLKLEKGPLLERDRLIARNWTGELQSGKLLLRQKSSKESLEYELLSPVSADEAGFAGGLDLLRKTGTGVTAEGWSLNTLSYGTPDALVVARGSSVEGVHLARTVRRQDIAKAHTEGHSFFSGFSLHQSGSYKDPNELEVIALYSKSRVGVRVRK